MVATQVVIQRLLREALNHVSEAVRARKKSAGHPIFRSTSSPESAFFLVCGASDFLGCQFEADEIMLI